VSNLTPQQIKRYETFLATTDMTGARLSPLAGDASFRRYVRLHGQKKTAMLMDAPPEREALAPFMRVARWLCENGYSAPHIQACDEAGGLMLLEDLGEDSLTRLCAVSGGSEQALYEAAVDVLADWYLRAQRKTLSPLPLPQYDQALLMREVELFSQWFLPQIASGSLLQKLSHDYLSIWRELLATMPAAPRIFVHRDYHADNLLWLPQRSGLQRLGLLDFQDAVLGSPAYDLVSLLEDARRDVSSPLVTSLLHRYLAATGMDREAFMAEYALLGAQRNCKIIGIFVRLAVRDGKAHYLDYLPRVWRHLATDLAHPSLRSLSEWMAQAVPIAQRGAELALAGERKGAMQP
jgi:hypothetical protein